MRRSSLFALLLLCPLLTAGTISRNLKSASGTTAWEDGDILLHDELNADFDTLYNEINGQISNVNIDAAAAIHYDKLDLTAEILDSDISVAASIDPGKIDDFSVNEAEMQTVADPGLPGSHSPALSLTGELSRLRFVIERLALPEADDGEWYSIPARKGSNWLRNASFEDQSAGATTIPNGWTEEDPGAGSAPTYAFAQVPLAEGLGQEVRVSNGDDALEGIEQVVTGLRASTRYVVVARVRPIVNQCQIKTLGGTTNFMESSGSGTGNYEQLSGVVLTDATPTDVTVQLLGVAATSQCGWDRVRFMEMDYFDLPGNEVVIDTYTGTDGLNAVFAGAPNPLMTASVTPPGPGYYIRVNTDVCGRRTGVADEELAVEITENASQVRLGEDGISSGSGGAENMQVSLVWANADPTPGTTYTYEVNARRRNGITLGSTCDSALVVELIKR